MEIVVTKYECAQMCAIAVISVRKSIWQLLHSKIIPMNPDLFLSQNGKSGRGIGQGLRIEALTVPSMQDGVFGGL